jgi:predicted dinucleotide-binding enzyme
MSRITIIGAGNMARGIAGRALAGGHDVQILARDPERAQALGHDLDASSTGGLDEVPSGDIVFLAVPYEAALSVVRDLGDRLAGKIVVDITNPVDFATFTGMVTPADTSAGQEISRHLPPTASVVKAFNTTFAGTLASGEVVGQALDVFVAGDDADTKAAVAALIESSALRAIDVGGLHMARYLEGLGFLHMSIQTTQGGNFATGVKVLGI